MGLRRLTGGGLDGGRDGSSDDASEGGETDAAILDEDAGTSGDDAADDAGIIACNLASSSICRGKCLGDASPCGCLRDSVSGTSYCGVTGSGLQGAHCSADTDCAPGYGCVASTGTCDHWCRPTSTVCPPGTSCQDATLVYSNANYGYCL